MQRLRDELSITDLMRYLWWRTTHSTKPLSVRLSSGTILTLRPPPASDLDVAYEIFVMRAYRPPRDLTTAIHRVVDAGANVGFSCLFWAQEYPGCTIIAFEPHPSNVESLKRQLAQNPQAKVELHAAAACANAGVIRLAGAENLTTVVRDSAGEGLTAPAEDFFQAIGSERIDLLKIDIEGGEYELLSDSRFASLDAPVLVLEWHRTAARPDGREYCNRRLSELGYQVIQTVPGEEYGILWAFKAVEEERSASA